MQVVVGGMADDYYTSKPADVYYVALQLGLDAATYDVDDVVVWRQCVCIDWHARPGVGEGGDTGCADVWLEQQ